MINAASVAEASLVASQKWLDEVQGAAACINFERTPFAKEGKVTKYAACIRGVMLYYSTEARKLKQKNKEVINMSRKWWETKKFNTER